MMRDPGNVLTTLRRVRGATAAARSEVGGDGYRIPTGAAVGSRRVSRGFSLLEVLIALAVLALALFALSRSAALAIEATQHREEVLLAGSVAANVLAEIRLAETTPSPGRREGQQQQGSREFYWRASIGDTDLPGIARIDIAVALDPARADTRVRLTGFAGRP